MKVRSSVKVINPEHPRAGQAGVVVDVTTGATEVSVRFDLDQPDQADELVPIADLQVLTDN